jgi:hypothetical protein
MLNGIFGTLVKKTLYNKNILKKTIHYKYGLFLHSHKIFRHIHIN